MATVNDVAMRSHWPPIRTAVGAGPVDGRGLAAMTSPAKPTMDPEITKARNLTLLTSISEATATHSW